MARGLPFPSDARPEEATSPKPERRRAMSVAAIATQEVPEVEIGMLDRSSFLKETIETPEPINVNITATILGDSVNFRLTNSVEGISTLGGEILVRRPNTNVNLVITLEGEEFTFQDPAILWVKPPQQGYSTNPFGTAPISPQFDGKTAIISNSTSGLTTKLTTPFALSLKDSLDKHTVVIDPTIIDDPNT
jgi:hypothetical protein